MDILISSNIERVLFTEFGAERTKELLENLAKNNFYELTSEETKIIQEIFSADFVTDSEIKEIIRNYSEKENYLLDPHTATCMKLYNSDKSETKKIALSTAEWPKFAPTVLNAINANFEKYSDKEALQQISEKLTI
jgi:threonine synthase